MKIQAPLLQPRPLPAAVPDLGRWTKMNIMRFLVGVLLISLCVSWGSEQQGARERFKIRAIVQGVTYLIGFTNAFVPVDIDPRFALTLRIESVPSALTNFVKGEIVTVGIHSPAMLFGAELSPEGKTMDFVLFSQATQEGKRSFYEMEPYRESHIVIIKSKISHAADEFRKSGTFTNDVPNLCYIYRFTNSITLGQTQQQCVLAAVSPAFGEDGFMAITTNDTLVWIDRDGKATTYNSPDAATQ
jgi:hypothetical protein